MTKKIAVGGETCTASKASGSSGCDVEIETTSSTSLVVKNVIPTGASDENTMVISETFPDIGVVSNAMYIMHPPIVFTDEQKKSILTHPFVPDASLVFPTRNFGKRKLRFRSEWIEIWEWLTYSSVRNGVFCKYCVIFSSGTAGKGSHQTLGSFVSKSFHNWKDATERFREHAAAKYHSKLCAENFLQVMNSTAKDVASQLSD